MYNPPQPDHLHDAVTAHFFERLQRLYDAMDHGYAKVAGHYEFNCNGCADNCCQTRFHHHTYIEYLFVLRGVASLDSEKQRQVQSRAAEVCRSFDQADAQGLPIRRMCPLNINGHCILYLYRPMICRLHGIPHQLQKPDQKTLYGPGCGSFDERCGGKPYFQFDRTPFYRDLARLENEFKQATGLNDRIKMTIARMIAQLA